MSRPGGALQPSWLRESLLIAASFLDVFVTMTIVSVCGMMALATFGLALIPCAAPALLMYVPGSTLRLIAQGGDLSKVPSTYYQTLAWYFRLNEWAAGPVMSAWCVALFGGTADMFDALAKGRDPTPATMEKIGRAMVDGGIQNQGQATAEAQNAARLIKSPEAQAAMAQAGQRMKPSASGASSMETSPQGTDDERLIAACTVFIKAVVNPAVTSVNAVADIVNASAAKDRGYVRIKVAKMMGAYAAGGSSATGFDAAMALCDFYVGTNARGEVTRPGYTKFKLKMVKEYRKHQAIDATKVLVRNKMQEKLAGMRDGSLPPSTPSSNTGLMAALAAAAGYFIFLR